VAVASDRVLARHARPSDYVPGGPLMWWMRTVANAFNRPYFLALLIVAEHRRPVPPFKTAVYYTALMEGKEIVQQHCSTNHRCTDGGRSCPTERLTGVGPSGEKLVSVGVASSSSRRSTRISLLQVPYFVRNV
jgi:hypothetical protein